MHGSYCSSSEIVQHLLEWRACLHNFIARCVFRADRAHGASRFNTVHCWQPFEALNCRAFVGFIIHDIKTAVRIIETRAVSLVGFDSTYAMKLRELVDELTTNPHVSSLQMAKVNTICD